MSKKKKGSYFKYKNGKLEIEGDSNNPDLIKLVKNDQIVSWIFKFIRLILAFATVPTVQKGIEFIYHYFSK